MSTVTRTRRSDEEWDALATELRPYLSDGGMQNPVVAERIGSNVANFQLALARQGIDAHGEPLEITPISMTGGPKAVAKRIAKLRQEKVSWWMLMAMTGMSYQDLKGTLAKYGYSSNGEQVSNGA